MLKSGMGEPVLSTSPRDPIYKLIETGKEHFPDLLKMNHVEGGRLKAETPDGTFELQIVALPPEEGVTAYQKFWEKVVGVRGGNVDEKPTPTPVSISPRVSLDAFQSGFHTQLMGNVPYAVMADGTRYAINVSAPIELKAGEWEEFEEKEVTPYGFESGRTKIGRRRKGLALVVRADSKPLIQKKLGTVTFDTFQEVLLGFHDEDGVNQAPITDKVTIQDSPRISLGESAETTSIKQHLEFHSLDTASVGTPSDKLGLIEVVVYHTISEEVSEIIDAPIPSIIESARTLSFGAVTRGGGGYSGGETAFGRERRQKVNTKGVRIEKPLATFQLALVGEMSDHGMEMTPQTEG